MKYKSINLYSSLKRIFVDILLGQSQQGGGIAAFLPFILIMFIIYFLMIRPQTKRQKEKDEMRKNIKKEIKLSQWVVFMELFKE